MDNIPTQPFVHAKYSPQRIPRYQGNPLIEALPPAPTEEQLVQMLTQMPDFHPDQRQWPISERLNLVTGLSNFCVPLARHVQLAYMLDNLMREGYVGRAPRTASHTQVLQRIYENQRSGVAYSPMHPVAASALTTALLGLSGMGKTTTFKRLRAILPEVIYHPELKIWQIPYLHVEAPDDGATVKGLWHSILRKVDLLIPDANYYEIYGNKAHTSTETLMNNVARVLHIHSLGVLIPDEIQNLENAPKGKQSVMTSLVSASNELGMPLVFCGTNKARRLLSLDFRQARRSVGHGAIYWDRLSKGTFAHPDEWDDFIRVLWPFQWVKNFAELNPYLSDLMYHHTQGIIDLAIKLFAACQLRAMLDGTEQITAQLISNVFENEFTLVHPMVEALRNNDLQALAAFDDVAPINMESLLRSARAKLTGIGVLGAAIRPGQPLFADSISDALSVFGVNSAQADDIAARVESRNSSTNVLEGMKHAIDELMPPKAGKKKNGKSEAPPPPLEQGDLRNASRLAKSEGTTVFSQLMKMGAVCDLRQVLRLH